MLLDDQLALYESAARVACAGLADRITSREMGLQSPLQGSTWLGLAIVESETTGDPRQRAELVVTTTISVAVRHTQSGFGQRLERWIDSVAHERILNAAGTRDLYGHIQSGQVRQVASDISGTLLFFTERTIRSVFAAYKMQRIQALGLTTRTDGGSQSVEDADTGRARDAYPQHMVSWASPGVIVGPVSAGVIYAGASGGAQIEILDADDAVVALVSVTTTPTGTVTTPSLAAGDYRARLIDVVTDPTLEITERPT